MLPTPSTSHVPYDLIYEPAEDSFLFLDTLSSASEKAWLQSRFSPSTSRKVPLLLELGPGSGVIIAFLNAHAKTIFGTDVCGLSVDVNPHAARATRMTVEKAVAEERQSGTHDVAATAAAPDLGKASVKNASVYLSSLIGDLTTPLRAGEIDILIFNPPYVPTDSAPEPTVSSPSNTSSTSMKPMFEESSALLELSYAGGPDGMQVTNRLLAQIPEMLSPRGVAYVLFCRGNKPEEVKWRIRAWEEGGDGWMWSAQTVRTSGKTAGWEMLEVVRIWREGTTHLLSSPS